MSGPSNLDLFTLQPSGGALAVLSGGAPWGRLYAALAISCLLHAALFIVPYFGASTARFRPDERGTQAAGPARVLDVRLEPARGPAAETSGQSDSGAGAPAAPAHPPTSTEPRPQQQLSRGADLLPVPAPAFYTAEQLTKPPEPMSRPEFKVPKDVARIVRGKVVLKVWIDALGNVVSVDVEQSNLPPAVSALAVEAFGKVRYVPGEIDGRSVGAQLKVEVVYDNRLKRP